jgi:hypothetical protein
VGINATGLSYENLLQSIRDFGDHPVLKHAASTKFRTAVLAAVPVASAHDLTGSYIVPWSELEQGKRITTNIIEMPNAFSVKFPPLVLEYDGNFKRIAMKLPNKVRLVERFFNLTIFSFRHQHKSWCISLSTTRSL